MNYKLYVVTANGYLLDYGDYVYLIGVYNNEKDANKAADDYVKQVKDACEKEKIKLVPESCVQISEVNLGETHPMKAGKYIFENELFLGGYIE